MKIQAIIALPFLATAFAIPTTHNTRSQLSKRGLLTFETFLSPDCYTSAPEAINTLSVEGPPLDGQGATASTTANMGMDEEGEYAYALSFGNLNFVDGGNVSFIQFFAYVADVVLQLDGVFMRGKSGAVGCASVFPWVAASDLPLDALGVSRCILSLNIG